MTLLTNWLDDFSSLVDWQHNKRRKLSRNMSIIRDKSLGKGMSKHISDKMVSRTYGIGRDRVLTGKNILSLVCHETVQQVWSRLDKAQLL
jgi:hypothetical protein